MDDGQQGSRYHLQFGLCAPFEKQSKKIREIKECGKSQSGLPSAP
jgi:hypothetical protein